MPTFTLELWKVLELYPSEDYSTIGLNDYPIFDETYRPVLNRLIVERYWNREIGLETAELFRFNMRRKMHEIMPLYNDLYRSTQIKFDPLKTMDIRTVATGESLQNSETTAEATSESVNESGSRSVQSDTPQVMLGGDKDYATSGTDATSKSTGTGGSSESATVAASDLTESTSETSGYQGSPADLIGTYRANLINVNLMVLDEVRELFMLVWNNGDEYSRRKGLFF